ncbi:MAG: yqgF, partial [Planctomycetaceae bacterium]|nr:yqgF [Planctomycetaceae bacterium]
QNQTVTIQDLGSVNGTFVNGHQIPPNLEVQLVPGTRVALGSLQFIVEYQLIDTPLSADGSSTILHADALPEKTDVSTDIYTASQLQDSSASQILDSQSKIEFSAAVTATAPDLSCSTEAVASPMDCVGIDACATHAEEPSIVESAPPLAATTPEVLQLDSPESEPAVAISSEAGSSADSEVPQPLETTAIATPMPESADTVTATSSQQDCEVSSGSFSEIEFAETAEISSEIAPQVDANFAEPVAASAVPSEAARDDILEPEGKSNQVQFEELMFELAPLSVSPLPDPRKPEVQNASEFALDRTSSTLFTVEVSDSIPAPNPARLDSKPVKRQLVPILNVNRTPPDPASATASVLPTKPAVAPTTHQPAAIPRSGHLLGVGCATNRIGYAVCNADQTIASLIENASQNDTVDAKRVLKLISEHHIVGLVIGLPVVKGATESQKSVECRQLGESLSRLTGLPMAFADDGSTSRFAAQVMLQRFLEGRRMDKSKAAANARVMTEC